MKIIAIVFGKVLEYFLKQYWERLFYHTWPTASGKHNYEIDFLLSRGFKICPVEVKSSGYKMHKSMDVFCKKFSQHVGLRYLAYTKDIRLSS